MHFKFRNKHNSFIKIKGKFEIILLLCIYGLRVPQCETVTRLNMKGLYCI
jgi:hypothetical protein